MKVTRTTIMRIPRLAFIAAIAMTLSMGVIPQATFAQEAPPLIEQINNGNWLKESEAQELVDELYYQRAIQAYYEMLPVMNTIGLRDGSEAVFGAGYNVIPVWKERMD